MKTILSLASVLLVTCAATAQAQPSGGQRLAHTTAPDSYVNIRVTLSDTRITLSRHTAPRGTDARFFVRNVGKRAHGFQLGATDRGLGFQSGFRLDVAPGRQKVLILFLDYRTKLPFFSPQKADLHNPNMRGFFTIGPCAPTETGNFNGC